MQLMTKAAYARRCGVSRQAITRFVSNWASRRMGLPDSSTPTSSTASTMIPGLTLAGRSCGPWFLRAALDPGAR